jgi:acetyl esterase
MHPLAVLSMLAPLCFAAPPGLEVAEEVVYKQTATRPLSLYLLEPKEKSSKLRPAILFFFGGGWVSGSVTQFVSQARYFATQGYVVALVDYRVKRRDETTPFEAVADARSAVRWMRANAARRRVNPRQIVAAGGSAGGHIAGATAVLAGSDDPPDDLRVSARPDALLLFNPVVDTTASGYGADFIGSRARELSLTAHVGKRMPPTIIFHGTADRTVPFANVVEFQRVMREAGNRCELVKFEGEDHGFFNSVEFRPKNSALIYGDIVAQATSFLNELFGRKAQ